MRRWIKVVLIIAMLSCSLGEAQEPSLEPFLPEESRLDQSMSADEPTLSTGPFAPLPGAGRETPFTSTSAQPTDISPGIEAPILFRERDPSASQQSFELRLPADATAPPGPPMWLGPPEFAPQAIDPVEELKREERLADLYAEAIWIFSGPEKKELVWRKRRPFSGEYDLIPDPNLTPKKWRPQLRRWQLLSLDDPGSPTAKEQCEVAISGLEAAVREIFRLKKEGKEVWIARGWCCVEELAALRKYPCDYPPRFRAAGLIKGIEELLK